MPKFTANFWQITTIFILFYMPFFATKSNGHKHQNEYWHWLYTDGRGDIAALWPIQEDAADGRMRNALRPHTKQRWTEYRDSRRQFVIPYRIVGGFSKFVSQNFVIIEKFITYL